MKNSPSLISIPELLYDLTYLFVFGICCFLFLIWRGLKNPKLDKLCPNCKELFLYKNTVCRDCDAPLEVLEGFCERQEKKKKLVGNTTPLSMMLLIPSGL